MRLVVTVAMTLVSARAGAFHFKVHEETTKEALKFLKAGVVSEITAKKHKEEIVITKGFVMKQIVKRPQDLHFDDCDYEGSTKRIRKEFKAAVQEIVKSKKQLAGADEFGAALHTIQDFYAHSNWVESGITELVDSRLSNWKPLTTWDEIGDAVLVGRIPGRISTPLDSVLSQTPPASVVSLKGRVVKVKLSLGTPRSRERKGIITGTYPKSDKENCIKEAKLGHWKELPTEITHPEVDRGGLNKDDHLRPNSQKAINLAVKQTRHEWCRLVHMVFEKGGAEAANRLIDNWVNDKAAAEAHCPSPATTWHGPPVQFNPLKSLRPGN
ncbi:MAG: hypothetical protein HYY84_06815 [Deltaproteobacteria bacterium]|nr:hypothetical protein [Deltaproteobacteria bacterium]